MPNSGDFRASGLVVVFLILTLVCFLIRRKWRIAAQRREEVKKLLVFASEEAARAEFEATVQYSFSVAATKQQCVVCYCPTTTRCSRCKAVKYCSGKCQIIHWRQGHREECYPATAAGEFNFTKGSDPDLKPVLRTTDLNPREKNPEIEGKCQAEIIEESVEKPKYSEPIRSSDIEAKPHEDTAKTDRVVTNSSSVSSSAGSTIHEAPILGTFAGSSSPLSGDVAADFLSNAADAQETVITKPQSTGFSSLCSYKLTPETSSDCSSTSFSGSSISSDSSDQSYSGSISPLSSDLPRQAAPVMLSHCSYNPRKGMPDNGAEPPNKFVTAVSLSRNSPVLGSEKLIATANNASTDVALLKHRQRSSSWGSSIDTASSVVRKKSVLSSVSSKVNSVDPVPVCSSETPTSTPNGNGLKTSMRKVVQQFRGSKPSKHSPLGCGNHIDGKSSKMLFPYDLFVKLYNWDKVEVRPCGLINCGNSCYANAVLQCLSFTRPLTAYLLQGLHTKSCPKKEWCFTCEFESLVLKAREAKCPLSPIRILSQIQSIGSNLGYGREEDAHEFLRYAIDTMQSVCINEAIENSVGPIVEETTLIQQVFGGYLRSNIKCLRCQGKSERHERMMDLTVEIQGNIGTLEEALSQFTATEILDGDNKYQCDRCKSYEKAKKKLTVYEAPNILTIALKRFQSGKFGKLNKFVRFPEILNLAPYMSEMGDKSPVYRLYAVVVHLDVMNASFSGHYVCYVKNLQGKWFKIDDNKVKPVEVERVLSKGAYMLLYARCTPRPPSLINNGVFNDHGKNGKNRYVEPVSGHNRNSISKTRFGSTFPNGSMLAGLRMPEDHRTARTGIVNSEAFEYFDERLLPTNRLSKIDTFSDSSSLFSCSDEGSCSTESTRDSTSTDEYSEYIFGDSGQGSWNSPFRFSEDSDGSSPPTLFSRSSPLGVSSGFDPGSPEKGLLNFRFTNQKSIHSEALHKKGLDYDAANGRGGRGHLQGEGNPSFIYPDPTSNQSRKLVDCCSSSEADSDLLGWVHPREKSDVALRKSSRERTRPFS